MSIGPISRRVAIVDDDESFQRALHNLVESDGLSTLCFSSAEQFLDSEARERAACLIADIRMEGMSGLELQAKLKAERCRIPIIFLTAHGDAEMRTLAIRQGAVEFLSKPCDDAVLLEIVHAAIGKREMPEQAHRARCRNGENRYATCEDFLKAFDEDMQGLYQLSFLLTGDHQKAKASFVAGFEDCVKESRVFRKWARTWAKRVIVQNAIRELHPRPSHSNSSALLRPGFAHKQQSGSPIEHLGAVLGLADFDRFVFVLCVLERYRERDCALLLGCSDSEVRGARMQAIEQLANFWPIDFNRHEGRKHGERANALTA